MEALAKKIQIDNVRKRFYPKKREPVLALDHITLSVRAGEFCSIVGPSGCGKSTLIRIIAGLETVSSGSITIYPEKNSDRPQTAMVFQEMSLFPWMTVFENVAYGLRMRREKQNVIEERVNYFLEVTGLRKFANSYPHQLSGGMKQRVSVARAFASDPEVLLMDEPFAALDEQNKYILQEELLSLWEKNKKTVLFITHSIDEAIYLSDRIFVMSAHPGRLKKELTVDIPRSERQIERLRSNPRFIELFDEIWELIKFEVRQATQVQA